MGANDQKLTYYAFCWEINSFYASLINRGHISLQLRNQHIGYEKIY